MRRIVITSSSGYIGRELALQLERSFEDIMVIRVDRRARHDPNGLSFRIDLAETRPADLGAIFRGAETIFHLAAARTDWGLSYRQYWRDNVLATRNVMRCARIAQTKRMVYFSTVGVYGPSTEPLGETARLAPVGAYGETKAEAESEVLAAAEDAGLFVRVIRPSAVFSEHQPENTNVYRLIEAVRRRRFVMIGRGSEIKTTSYLHNVVDAALWLYQDLDSGGLRVFNYVDEPKLSTRKMVNIVRQELGCVSPLIRLPLPLIEPPARALDMLGDLLEIDIPITAARIRKFCTPTDYDSSRIRLAGFQPQFTSLSALRRTVSAHKPNSTKASTARS